MTGAPAADEREADDAPRPTLFELALGHAILAGACRSEARLRLNLNRVLSTQAEHHRTTSQSMLEAWLIERKG